MESLAQQFARFKEMVNERKGGNLDHLPTSATYGVSSGIAPAWGYGYDGARGLEGKDAMFFALNGQRELTSEVCRNSKEDAIQILETKYQIASFQKDTQIQLERLQRETLVGMEVLRAQVQSDVRAEAERTRSMISDSESRRKDQEFLLLQLKALITPPAPAP